MKSATFSNSEMLAGTASMLELLGFNTDDQTIARGMEAPFLFVHDGDRYRAGMSLYQPRWINLYLNAHGFHMNEEKLPKDRVPAFLRAHTPAMLRFAQGNHRALAVFTGYAEQRYHFHLVQVESSPALAPLALTTASLKRRLADDVSVYTLSSCEQTTADFLPLLTASFHTLTAYQEDLLSLREQVVNRTDMPRLHATIFRPLMADMLPMAALANDLTLAEELRLLNHDYRHMFISPDQQSVTPSDRLPKTSIKKCIAWIKELICDRLYELGAPDETVDALYLK